MKRYNHFNDRTAFNFYRSYYEISLLLPDEDRIEFLDCILKSQFEGEIIEPKRQFALLAFRGQIHSIKKQILGFSKGKETYPNGNPTKGTYKGNDKGNDKGSYKEVQEEEQEEVKVKDIYDNPFEDPKPKITDKQRIEKFTEWFNGMIKVHKGVKGRFSTMTQRDLNNLKKLRDSYGMKDFEYAFNRMMENDWVIENNKATIDHLLANNNFMKYLNSEPKKPQPKIKPAWD